MAGFDNNFPQGLQNLMQARRGLNPATPAPMGNNMSASTNVLDKSQPQPFMAGSQPVAQVQQPQGGFGQQLMQQGQPQMIRAQLQGEIVSPQPQGGMMPAMGGLGGGITPSMISNLSGMGGMGRGSVPPEIIKTMMSATPQPQQNQGLGGLAAYGPQAYKAGGSVNLKDAAQKLAAKGRGGDTILAHINPQEAAMLKRMGGSGTINPHTGLREYGWFKKLTGISTPGFIKDVDDAIIQPIAGAAKDIVEPILPYVKYVAPFIPGVGPALAVGLGALSSGFAGPGGFNLKRGIMGGITAYGMSNIAAGLGEAGAAGGSDFGATSTPGASSVANTPAPDYSLSTGGSGVGINPNASLGAEGMGSGIDATVSSAGSTAAPTEGISWANTPNPVNAAPSSGGMWDKLTTNPYTTGDYLQGMKNLTGLGPQGYAGIADASKAFGTKAGMGSAAATLMGTTGEMAVNEAEKFKQEAEDAANLQEAKRKRYRTLGLANMEAHPWKKYAEGGAIEDNQGLYGQADGLATGGTPISNFARGGTTNPRFLSGGGDGMSDSIPATIDNKQPARLADGEFVIPADVVSHIGNGSSKAGAKRLYSMMANVRKARTGNPNQGKQINPKKYLPA